MPVFTTQQANLEAAACFMNHVFALAWGVSLVSLLPASLALQTEGPERTAEKCLPHAGTTRPKFQNVIIFGKQEDLDFCG